MNTPLPNRPLKPATLKTAGLLAMTSAVLTLPLFFLSLMMDGRHDETANVIHLALQWTGTILFVIVTFSFRQFLCRNLSFCKADNIISALIILNLVYALASSAGVLMANGDQRVRSIAISLVILIGMLQTGLGIRLFGIEQDLYGMKNFFCWLTIVTGVCLASLLLLPFGIITSAMCDVMLGTIFFHEARRPLPGMERT